MDIMGFKRAGRRLNPGIVPQNFAANAADIRTIASKNSRTGQTEDFPICGVAEIWSEGDPDEARVMAWTNPNPADPQGNPGLMPWWSWIRTMRPALPRFLSIWVGCNDALGAAVTQAKIVEAKAYECSIPYPVFHRDRNLTEAESFEDTFRLMLKELVQSYKDKPGEKPVLTFLLVPDVTSLPALGKLKAAAGPVYQPFQHSNIAVSYKSETLNEYFREASFRLSGDHCGPDPQGDGLIGRISFIPLIKQYAAKRFLQVPRKRAVKTVFGMPAHPRVLDCGSLDQLHGQEDILREHLDVRRVSDRIKEYNRSMVKIIMKPGALGTDPGDAELNELMDEWRQEGRIHIFDTHWLFSQLAIYTADRQTETIADEDPLRFNHETLSKIGDAIGIPAEGAPGATNEQKRARDLLVKDARFIEKYYTDYVVRSGVLTSGQEGLVGPDYVHPTRTGQAILANGIMLQLKEARDENTSQLTIWGNLSIEKMQFESDNLLDLGGEMEKDPWRPGRYDNPPAGGP